MINLTVKIKLNNLPVMAEEAERVVDAKIRELAFDGERYIKQSFGTSPSEPGDPPGVVSGTLKNSVTVVPVGSLQYAIITRGVEYAPHLEYGTTKMAARPFMAPAAQWLERQVPDKFKGML